MFVSLSVKRGASPGAAVARSQRFPRRAEGGRREGISARASSATRQIVPGRAGARAISGVGRREAPHAQVLRNQSVGRMSSRAVSGPRLVAVIRMAISSGPRFAYSMTMSK